MAMNFSTENTYHISDQIIKKTFNPRFGGFLFWDISGNNPSGCGIHRF